MTNGKSVSRANALYRSGAYREALVIYEDIASRPGWGSLVRANIALCRKRLGLEAIKLSVIVPVFNTAKYLEQCLRSILNQSEPSLEVIVINDGSTDDSLEIIRRLMAGDGRIVLINNEKPSGNPGTPRNQGIAIARGTYLGFVDSDDWVESDYFASLLAAIDKSDADLAFAAGYMNHFKGESKPVEYDSRHFSAADSELHRYHESFMIWDKVYRTSLVKNLFIRLGETKAAVDVPFIFKAYYLLEKASFATTKGYNYRRESSASVTVNFRKSSNCEFEIQAYNDVEKWCQNAGVDAKYRDLVRFRKVSSYAYTLSVIAASEFHAFFAKIKPELMSIDSGLIESVCRQLKRRHIFEKFRTIVTETADAYIKLYRADISPAPVAIAGQTSGGLVSGRRVSSIEPIFEIDGDGSGLLYFPDWSRSNPYQKLFYSSLGKNFGVRIRGYRAAHLLPSVIFQNKEKFSYLHLHWLHALMDVSREDGADDLLSNLEYAKKLGYRIIYTAHNIVSHDGEFLDRELRFRRKIAAYYDHVLAHGEFAKQRLVSEIGVHESKIHVMPHGTYQGHYPNDVTPAMARSAFEIAEDKFVYLFFGNIRGYKGIDALLEAYRKISAERNDVRLLIAGRVFDRESDAKIRAHAKADPSILFRPDFVQDSEVQCYFKAADLVVLPYKRILTSGAALLSASFERPVIAPRSGLIPELVEDGKHGYLFDDHEGMLALMREVVVDRRRDPKAWAARFDFSALNARLRWPVLTAHPAFERIFSASVKTEERCIGHRIAS